MLFSCGALLVLALAAYWTARLAWADRLSTSSRLEDRRRAVRLAPLDAALYGRLAEKLEETGGDSLPSLEAAAALDPQNPQWRMDLGLQAEMAGDFPLAERSLLAAARLSRLYQPKYLLAGYYFRRGNADLCKRWSKAALAIAPGDVTPVLNLLEHLLEPREMAAEGVCQPSAVARQFLTFMSARGQSGAAGELALHIAETGSGEDLPTLLGYADQLLSEGQAVNAVTLWNALCVRRLLPDQPLDPNGGRSLTNASFQHVPSGRGFDWHTEGTTGMTRVRFDGAFRAAFSGDEADDYVVIWQYVPLIAGARYRLRQDLRVEDSASGAGFAWRLYSPGKGSAWAPAEANLIQEFRATGELGRLVLMYRRAPGSRRFTGDISISSLRLDKSP
jgi:hypothetical protein